MLSRRQYRELPIYALANFMVAWFGIFFSTGAFFGLSYMYFIFETDGYYSSDYFILWFFIVFSALSYSSLAYYAWKMMKFFVVVKSFDQSFNYNLFLFLFWVPILSIVVTITTYKKAKKIVENNGIEIRDYDWTRAYRDLDKNEKNDNESDDIISLSS